jgi:hypothetical protein
MTEHDVAMMLLREKHLSGLVAFAHEHADEIRRGAGLRWRPHDESAPGNVLVELVDCDDRVADLRLLLALGGDTPSSPAALI